MVVEEDAPADVACARTTMITTLCVDSGGSPGCSTALGIFLDMNTAVWGGRREEGRVEDRGEIMRRRVERARRGDVGQFPEQRHRGTCGGFLVACSSTPGMKRPAEGKAARRGRGMDAYGY